jgi:hypothetical protein
MNVQQIASRYRCLQAAIKVNQQLLFYDFNGITGKIELPATPIALEKNVIFHG